MSARSTPPNFKKDATALNVLIAKLVREHRMQANITQLELSIQADCSEKRIRAIEQGGGGPFDTVWKIITYLKIPFEKIPKEF